MTKNLSQAFHWTLFWFLMVTGTLQLVHGNPVRIQHTSNSVDINGKTLSRDIYKELSPEVEAAVFGSFEFGLGDKSSKSHERRNGRYNRGDWIRFGRRDRRHSHSSSSSSSSEEHRHRYRNEYRFGFPRFF